MASSSSSSSPPRMKAPSPTSTTTVTDTLMQALEPWVAGFTDVQLRPFGQVPAETIAFSRRHSRQPLNNIEVVRVPVELPISNRGIVASFEVISMTFTPPIELGVNRFTVNIPSQWWKALKLTPEDTRSALKEEIRALLEGRPARDIFLMNYMNDLRDSLEDHIRALPATMFDLNLAFNSPSRVPASFTYGDWTTTRHVLPEEGTTRLTFEGTEVEMKIIVPNDLHQSTSAIQDWVLLQVCL